MRFACFAGTVSALRLPAVLPAALRFSSRGRYHWCTAGSLPCRRAVRRRGWVALVSRLHPVLSGPWVWRRQALPGSWATPLCFRPVLRPRRNSAPGPRGACVLPGLVRTSGLPVGCRFRGSFTRHRHSLSTLPRRRLHPHDGQDSLPAGGQPLPGGIRYPLGCTESFASDVQLIGILFLQAFPGATDRRLQYACRRENETAMGDGRGCSRTAGALAAESRPAPAP